MTKQNLILWNKLLYQQSKLFSSRGNTMYLIYKETYVKIYLFVISNNEINLYILFCIIFYEKIAIDD